MYKAIMALALVLAANVAGAENFSDEGAALDSELYTEQPLLETLEDDGEEVEFEEAQWYPNRRVWTCWARNRRGQMFRGQAWSRHHARRIAMNRCARISASCALWRCR